MPGCVLLYGINNILKLRDTLLKHRWRFVQTLAMVHARRAALELASKERLRPHFIVRCHHGSRRTPRAGGGSYKWPEDSANSTERVGFRSDCVSSTYGLAMNRFVDESLALPIGMTSPKWRRMLSPPVSVCVGPTSRICVTIFLGR